MPQVEKNRIIGKLAGFYDDRSKALRLLTDYSEQFDKGVGATSLIEMLELQQLAHQRREVHKVSHSVAILENDLEGHLSVDEPEQGEQIYQKDYFDLSQF